MYCILELILLEDSSEYSGGGHGGPLQACPPESLVFQLFQLFSVVFSCFTFFPQFFQFFFQFCSFSLVFTFITPLVFLSIPLVLP